MAGRLSRWLRVLLVSVMVLTAGAAVFLITVARVIDYAFEQAAERSITYQEAPANVSPFPVGVDPLTKTIDEQPNLGLYRDRQLAYLKTPRPERTWREAFAIAITQSGWSQHIAASVGRVLVIYPGERREQVVDHFGDILRWEATERERFATLVADTEPAIYDGKFLPGHYLAHRHATPEEAAALISDRFNEAVRERYTEEVARVVPLSDALTIASLLEREARDFTDMRLISGIIWNRLFSDMPLQLDATLQYVRGSRRWEPSWWPTPRPADKFIASPYNTYQNAGLPPSPIANPSPEAILAALNPRQTDCRFYFHDAGQDFHCSKTYEEHVQRLRQHYGRGR